MRLALCSFIRVFKILTLKIIRSMLDQLVLGFRGSLIEENKKNLLFQLIENSEFEIDLFQGHDPEDTELSDFVIELTDSPLKFEVITVGTNFDYHAIVQTMYRSGYPRFRWPGKEGMFSGKWHELEEKLTSWLDTQVRSYIDEINAEDYWSQLTRHSPESIDPLAKLDYDKFSQDEVHHITESLEKFRSELLRKFEHDADNLEQINLKVDYLSSALERLNRTDWKALAMGTLISLGIALNFDTATGVELKQWISEVSKPVVSLIGN